MTLFKAYDGSSFRNARRLQAYDGSTWRDIKRVQVYDGSTWQDATPPMISSLSASSSPTLPLGNNAWTITVTWISTSVLSYRWRSRTLPGGAWSSWTSVDNATSPSTAITGVDPENDDKEVEVQPNSGATNNEDYGPTYSLIFIV